MIGTSNQWTSRSRSTGFYNIIEDAMLGPKSLDRIRRYGTFWYHNDTMYRIYLYEARALQESGRSVVKIAEILKPHIETGFEEKFALPDLQHNFAEDNGQIRDLVQIWTLKDTCKFHLYDQFYCVKVTKVNHFVTYNSKTAKADYHILVEQCSE